MNKKIPLRQCIGCGEMHGKKEMMRVVKTADGRVSLDMTGRANGRGAYLCRRRECLEAAIKSKGLERSFKMSLPENVYTRLQEEFAAGETR